MRSLLVLLLVAFLFTQAVPGQTPKPDSPGPSGAPNAATGTSPGSATGSSKVDGAEAKPTIKPMPPGYREKPLVLRKHPAELAAEQAKLPGNKAGVVSFRASCEPLVVPAGELGTMRVLMTLGGDAVMLDPPPVEFTIEPQQGDLSILADPKFQPSQPAGLAPALKGLPVYDNFAIFDVLFATAADCAPGPQHLELKMRYQLINGKKGGMVGTFTDVIGLDVEVVAAAPEPASATNAVRGGADEPLAAGASENRVAPMNTNTAIGGNAGTAAPSPAAEPDAAIGPSPSAVQADMPWGLYAAGGAAALILLLLVMRRRRG